jgi:Fe-S cluster biogenesis protein NfuA
MPMNATAQTRQSTPEVRKQLLGRIENVLNERVRPGLIEDGGEVQVVGIDEDHIVQVRLLGACQGCVSSVVTTTMFIEKAVKAEVPEVRFLEAIP